MTEVKASGTLRSFFRRPPSLRCHMFMFAQVPESCCILQGPRRDLVPADNGCVTGPNRQNSYFNKVARDMCRNSAISANWFFWLNFSTNPLQIWFSSIHPERLCSLFLRTLLQGCYNKFVNSVKNNQVEMLRPVAKKAFVYRSLQLFSWTGTKGGVGDLQVQKLYFTSW